MKFVRLLFAGLFQVIFFVTYLSLPIKAQEVVQIIENGNKVDLPKELSLRISSDSTDVKNIILSWFGSRGYLNASIKKSSAYSYEMNKGCRFRFSELLIREGIDKKLTWENSGYYSEERLESQILNLIDEYEAKGYTFAKVEVESINPNVELCQVSVSVNLIKGERQVTEGVLFVGASVNKAEYLKRISGYQDSLLITPDLLNRLASNLIQSELFLEVGNPEVFIRGNKAVLIIPVEERILNQFDGLLGYVPDQNGNGQIVGDFDLSLWNVLNQGNGINLSYQRLKPETSRLSVGVSQNWIGSIPVGVGFDFSLYQNDTTYQTRNLSLDGFYLLGNGLRLTGEIGSLASTSSGQTSIIQEPEGKKRYAELGFVYSSLDNIEVPTRGARISTSFGISNKSVDIDSINAFNQRYMHSKGSYFLPISKKSVLAFFIQGYLLNANNITENDLIRFGGANSIRGYSEEQFRASELIWGDIEYRFLVNRSSYLFGFGSFGRYHRPKLLTELDNSFKKSGVLYSTGFGISYKIRTGRLKFAYAISPEESIGNGKVHIGITTKL